MDQQDYPPPESHDSHQSNSTTWQEPVQSQPRFRGHGHYQGPYSTSNTRTRPYGDFQQRPRYPYNKRGGGGGGYRHQNRDSSSTQQQEQSADNNEYPSTTNYYGNRTSRGFFRANMLDDPWIYMKPVKVPANGTTLVFDSTN
ncbi:unnamed protein product [Adineta ricciae]|uniref:Uncharacterized protein n=1 Tax=Adineta ricciae TaxID=249248 RepID=A0A814SF58_ADIRI|nr:unnamed protein product [Adineta ricciae]CAF1146591.1 unnamed protein product [Adineta ricciae]